MLGIAGLVIIDRRSERHEQRGHPGGRDLGDGERACAAHHEVGLGVGCGDVIDEGLDARGHPGVCIAAARAFESTRAGLMTHLPSARWQHRERSRHRGVQARGTLTAADHQQPQRPGACAVTDGGCGQCEERWAYGVADDEGTTSGREAARKSLQHRTGETGKHTVGEAGDGVLFVDHQRPTQQPCGETARTGDIAPESDHHCGTLSTHRRDRLPERTQHRERRAQQRHETLAPNPADRDPFHRYARRRHQTGLDTVAGAQPHHLTGALAEDLGQRERWEYMPTGTARHDHDASPAHGRAPSASNASSSATLRAEPPRSAAAAGPRAAFAASWNTRSSRPTQASPASMLERP